MKTREEILAGMHLCADPLGKCEGCPYRGDERVGRAEDIFSCGEALMRDAIAYIEAVGDGRSA